MSLTDDDKQWITEQLGTVRGQIEATETRLLTEFFKWSSPMETRVRSHSAALRSLDVQQETFGDVLKTVADRNKALVDKGRQ